MFAVEANAINTAKYLIGAGADKQLKDQFGRNALAYAKLTKNHEIQRLLSK